MMNEISKKNNKGIDNRKLLLIKRYELSKDKQGKIIEQIKNFNESEKIFEFNNKIKLGKLQVLKGPRFDENKNLIPYSYVGSDRYFINQRREAIKNVTHLFKYDRQKRLDKSNKENNSVKSETNINSRFTKYFSRFITSNNVKEEERNLKLIPKFLTNNLAKQERIFKRKGNFENIEENIEKRLIKKTKKNKKNLLLKLSDVNNLTDGYKKSNEFNANFTNWNFKLRNPKINGFYTRQGYFKATSLNEDLFSIINLNKDKDIFVNPFKNIYHLSKSKSLNKKMIKEVYLTTLKLNGIKILEKNILNKRIKNKNNNSIEKLNKNFFSYETNENDDKNLSENYKDKIFALNYNSESKYNKSKSLYKFHN